MEKTNGKKIIKSRNIILSLAIGITLYAIYSFYQSNSSYDLDEAIEHAHTYLNKQILPDGKFIYRKHMDSHKYLEPEYNILRHMGSIYSLIMMNDYKQGSMDFEKVGHSIQFIKDNSFEKINDNMMGIWTTAKLSGDEGVIDQMKLGSAGLVLVGFAPLVDKMPGLISKELLKQIGNTVLHMQKPDGSFYSKMYRDGSFEIDWISLYYPGEAVFGLVELFRVTEDEKYLDAGIKALLYLEESRRNLSVKDMPADHWALIASSKLLKYSAVDGEKKQRIISHAEKIVKLMLSQQIKSSSSEALIGGFSLEGETTPTSVCVEGLNAFYPYLLDRELMKSTRSGISLAIDFLLRTQIKETPFQGAWRRSAFRYDVEAYKKIHGENQSYEEQKEHNETMNEIRIDYVQHALSALIGYQQLFKQK